MKLTEQTSTSELQEAIGFIFATYPSKMAFSRKCQRLGKDAAASVGRKQPWGRTYVSTAFYNSFGEGKTAGKDFVRAILALAASIESGVVPALVNAGHEARVFTWKWNFIDGAFVIAKPRMCRKDGCTMTFIPNTANRVYCPSCSPPGWRLGADYNKRET